jgi:serine/threonine protein kinase
MVLECLDESLEDRLRRQAPLPDDVTYRIATEIAAGLAHAHAHGVVHRDLKPANVLFDHEGRAKLADFGVARIAAAGGTLTDAGTLIGTSAYMSPEQASGASATAASDVYSFGVTLHRMLTGKLPFESRSALELVRLHREQEPPPPSSFRADMPPHLAAVVTATMAKDPSMRPQDGAALLDLLADGGGGAATAVTEIIAVPPSRHGRRSLVIALLGALALAGAGLAWEVTRSGGTTAPPITQPPPTHHSTSLAGTVAPPTTAARQTTTPTTTPTTPTTPRHQTTSTAAVSPVPARTTTAVTTAPTTTAATTAPTTTAISTTIPTTVPTTTVPTTTEPVTTAATTAPTTAPTTTAP